MNSNPVNEFIQTYAYSYIQYNDEKLNNNNSVLILHFFWQNTAYYIVSSDHTLSCMIQDLWRYQSYPFPSINYKTCSPSKLYIPHLQRKGMEEGNKSISYIIFYFKHKKDTRLTVLYILYVLRSSIAPNQPSIFFNCVLLSFIVSCIYLLGKLTKISASIT